MNPDLISAMRADNIPPSKRGLWSIKKIDLDEFGAMVSSIKAHKNIEAGKYTVLQRLTDSTMEIGGDVVMLDTEQELPTHLNFINRASGEVLVTGLGLGCVVRGLLEKDSITKITVLESDEDVLEMVMPYMSKDPRLEVILTDAESWIKSCKDRYDYVWHDIWTDMDAGEPPLLVAHVNLMKAAKSISTRQGCWGIHRPYEKLLRRYSFWYTKKGVIQ